MKTPKNNRYKSYLRFSSVAIQMGVTIAAGALGGDWLDKKQENDFPIWTLILTLFTVFASLYLVIKEVIKMGKDEDEKKKSDD